MVFFNFALSIRLYCSLAPHLKGRLQLIRDSKQATWTLLLLSVLTLVMLQTLVFLAELASPISSNFI